MSESPGERLQGHSLLHPNALQLEASYLGCLHMASWKISPNTSQEHKVIIAGITANVNLCFLCLVM